MIEIYKNSTEFVGLTLYSNGGPFDAAEMPTVTLVDNDTGELIVADQAVSHDELGKYSYLIGLDHTQEERTIRVEWTFYIGAQAASKVDFVQVVTPYVTPDEARALYPELESLSFDQIKELEKRARFIINASTGQNFGLRRGSLDIILGSGSMYLSQPILEVDRVEVGGMPFNLTDTGIMIDSNGWVVRTPQRMGHFYYTSYMPELRLWKGSRITLFGKFGYRAVPMDISMAAAMLVKDYSCREDVWRQKGLDAVKAADWRFEYGDNTYKGTGNVDVDFLLSAYRRVGAAIL